MFSRSSHHDSVTPPPWRAEAVRAAIRAHAAAIFAVIFAALALARCGDGPSAPGAEENDEPDTTPPTVASTSPDPGAADVDVATTIRATFSEDMDPATLNAGTFLLDPAVPGSISYASRTATFAPSAPLDSGTAYTATITTGARDQAGNPLAQGHSWTFSTAEPPPPAVPAAGVPFATGKRWRYEAIDTTVVCASSTGCSKDGFQGSYYVHVEAEASWQGRSAWRTMVYRLQGNPGAEAGFRTITEYLAQDETGLWQWVATGEGGEWRQILSRTAASFGNSTFFLADGPAHGDEMVLSPGSATVPAGTFTTVKALHEFKQTGRYAPEDIFETTAEHYADGVGLVLASWDYSFDDNDPAGTDIVSKGMLALTHVDEGPFPAFVAGAEANDTADAANAAAPFAIIAGETEIGDAGAIIDDAGVGCTAECVFANVNGEKKLQDWYRFELTATTTIRIELAYTYSIATSNLFSDLDLYAFDETESGPRYIGSSVLPPGQQEILTGTLPPGTYYLAVQAWDTPNGRVPYWMSIR